jgi:capsular exopolysaccharide synthesis family protein
MVQYNVLKREMDSSQQLYTTMLTRAKEAAVSEKLEVSNIRIVDAAKPPGSPYKPKLGKDLLMSALFALFLGVAVSFLLEYLDASIRTAEEVSTYLNLPFLGYIPSVIADAKTESERDLLCFQKPKSTITESYRALRTSILFASPEDKPLKSILITSALPEEGKSFIASNLAIIFAQVNERVILLDVDMRRPSTHKSFNLEQKAGGLSNFLTGAVELEKIIRPTPVPNLSIIPSGTIPPNPSELLTSAKVKLLFDELKTRFDRVIMDSPPILSVADSSLLSNVVDGVVLVVKGGFTRLEAAIKAKEKILAAKGRIIGALVNNIEPEKEDRYYYYHYYYSQDYLKPK